MQITKFKIKDRTIYQISNHKLIGIVGQDIFSVAFQDEGWDGLHKTMKIVRSDGKIVKLALANDEVELTQECYIPGVSKVGFYGTINEDDPEELKIISTDYAQITFLEHAYDNEDGVAITDPTPSQYDILIGKILDTKDEVDALKVELEDEITEIERKVRDGEFDGVGISNIEKISTVGLVDTYQINYTDGSSTTFEVTNGEKGDEGVGIVSIIQTSGTSAPGTTDVYTITLSNGDTFNFNVYNGKDDYDDTEIRQELAGKQDTLTAGTGISISNNIISVSEGFSVVVVAELPNIGEPNTLYLVPTGDPSPNYCNEYIYVDNIGWELVGTTQIDLSNYYTKSDTDTLLDYKVNKSFMPGVFFIEVNNLMDLSYSSSINFNQSDLGKFLDVAKYKEANPEKQVLLFLSNTVSLNTFSYTPYLIFATKAYYSNVGMASIQFVLIFNHSSSGYVNKLDEMSLTIFPILSEGVITGISQVTLYRGNRTELEMTSNKVTTISSNSTDTQYPSAAAVYNYVSGGSFVTSSAITTIWKGTQQEYDDLGTYDNQTMYIIE